MTAIYTLLIIALINVLALQQKSVFIYLIAVPLNMVYGLNLAADNTVNSPLWIAGVTIAVIGTFYLFRVAVSEAVPMKRMRKK